MINTGKIGKKEFYHFMYDSLFICMQLIKKKQTDALI